MVTVAGAINREVAASYNIIVRATSSDTSFSTQSFTIAITDVNEFSVGSVSDTNASANSVVENATIGTTVGITASASDGDATNSGITYSLQNNDGGRFTIDANTGVVTVAGAINRETDGASRSITVRALSQDGSFTDQVFSISIVDANEFAVSTPTDTNAALTRSLKTQPMVRWSVSLPMRSIAMLRRIRSLTCWMTVQVDDLQSMRTLV